jgi:hypothetical protein
LDSEPVPTSLENVFAKARAAKRGLFCHSEIFVSKRGDLPRCCKPLVKNLRLNLAKDENQPRQAMAGKARQTEQKTEATLGL